MAQFFWIISKDYAFEIVLDLLPPQRYTNEGEKDTINCKSISEIQSLAQTAPEIGPASNVKILIIIK